MKTSRIRLLYASIALTVFLGCGSNGSEYVGKWQTIASPHHSLEIAKDGKVFLVKSPQGGFLGPVTISTTAATLSKNDTLDFQTGFGVSSITYVKSTGHLLVPGVMGSIEYVHAQ